MNSNVNFNQRGGLKLNRVLSFLIVIFILILPNYIFSETSVNHRVTVHVAEINIISVEQSTLYFTIDTDEAGSNLTPIIDSGGKMRWTTNGNNRKITITALSPTIPGLEIQIKALDCVGGLDIGWVIVDNYEKDLILEISKVAGSCNLVYQVTATTESDPGDYSFDISYKLTTN